MPNHAKNLTEVLLAADQAQFFHAHTNVCH
jgi:hypothetical protein